MVINNRVKQINIISIIKEKLIKYQNILSKIEKSHFISTFIIKESYILILFAYFKNLTNKISILDNKIKKSNAIRKIKNYIVLRIKLKILLNNYNFIFKVSNFFLYIATNFQNLKKNQINIIYINHINKNRIKTKKNHFFCSYIKF